MSPAVLLLTCRHDLATDYIAAALADRSTPFLRLNSEDLSHIEVCWEPLDSSLVVEGGELPRTLVGQGLRGVLVRRPTSLRSGLGTPQTILAAHHWLTFLHGLQTFRESRWMNFPASDFLAENKMVQLRAALDIGFRIPSTVVTNSARAALRHLHDRAGFAVKGLDTVLWRKESNQYFCFTQMLDAGELRVSNLSDLPTIVQEQLRPKTDIRVTVVGDRVWAAAITDSDGAIDGDWRLRNDQAVYAEHALPDAVSRRCVKLTRHLNLSFAAIDLALCGDEYVYLELNPVGEWAWLAESLGWDVAHAMAAWLSDEK